MGTARFGKVLTAMVTPFTDDGDLDLDGAAALARWLVDQGNDGLVLAGTTGEAPTLTDDEKVELWRAVRAAVDVPLLAGTGSNDTRHTVELSRRAAETGVDGLLVVSRRTTTGRRRRASRPTSGPWPPPSTCRSWSTTCPIRTGRAIEVDTLRAPGQRGAHHRRPSRTPAATSPRRPRSSPGAPDDFDLYSGDTGLTLPLLAVGAVGVVGVCHPLVRRACTPR